MKGVISAKKLCRVLYWTLYLSLCFISGWFASGVIENYMSGSTSFSQSEETAITRPVITIDLTHKSRQKFVLPQSQSVTLAIVFKCFENKNNNCCQILMLYCLLKMFCKSIIWSPPEARTSQPQCGQKWICGTFLINNMAFLFDNNYCFYFQNIWIQWPM